ncbi:aminoacyl-tRNA hydrolase [Candidatus Nomurabacteria bacterium]|nr:aminoacyl-tRNA hydrolase [Candidatus Nomurabacteria bacterium]
MSYIIVGLGNPGEEYKDTRHNTGRIIVESLRKKFDFEDWSMDKKSNALISKGKIGKEAVIFLMPETFMNKSGLSVRYFVKNPKSAKDLVVVYDDMDLPIGKMKISFNRGSGGHRGLESVAKNVKTLEFLRVRVGTSPATASGKTKKPQGEKEVEKFILGKFKPKEVDLLKKLSKKIADAMECFVKEGKDKTMSIFN